MTLVFVVTTTVPLCSESCSYIHSFHSLANNVSITNNNMTGLAVHASSSEGTSVFYNNTGIDGGGLAIYDDSYLYLQKFFLNFTITLQSTEEAFLLIHQQIIGPVSSNMRTHFLFSKSNYWKQSSKAGTVLLEGHIHCFFSKLSNIRDESFKKHLTIQHRLVLSNIIRTTDVCFCDENNTINCS